MEKIENFEWYVKKIGRGKPYLKGFFKRKFASIVWTDGTMLDYDCYKMAFCGKNYIGNYIIYSKL